MKKTLAVAVSLLIVITATAQTKAHILTILEKDPDLLYKKDEQAFSNRRFADINSTLQISINKEQISNTLFQGSTGIGLPSDIERVLNVLQATLQKQAEFMERFRSAISTYNSNIAGVQSQTFNKAMKDLDLIVIKIEDLDPIIKQYALNNNATQKFVPFFDAVKRRLDELKRYQEGVSAANSSSVQMGAWLIRDNIPTPVHLQGFDNLPKGEYYEVARWNFIPSNAQLAQLNELQKNSIKGRLDIQSIFSQAVDSFKNQLTRSLEYLQLAKIKATFDTLITNESAIADTSLKNNIRELEKLLQADADLFAEKEKYYHSLSIQAKDILPLTAKVIDDIMEIDTRLNELTNKLTASKQSIEEGLLHANGNIKSALTFLNNYFAGLPDNIHKLIDGLKPDDFRSLKKQYDFNTNTLEFSKDILKFSLQDLPSSTELDLRRTGMRTNGDHIVLKLSVHNGGENKVLAAEEADIELNLLASHIEGTVGVVLAMPVSITALKSGVQVAPYYNILFKGFRNNKQKKYREKGNNNDLFAMNFGIHASIPDFNLDGVPEIGVGALVSFLKDYVQAGWAFNFFEKTGYWFFGTRFPIGPFGANSSAASKNVLSSSK